MLLERIVSEGLAHYSYLVGDRNLALVIDPRRDVDDYIKMAAASGMRIAHILETHRNEDYFIGSMELATRTGAEVWHADRQWDYQYGHAVADGQRWKVGRLEIEAISTPGHTPGSMSYLLRDPAGIAWMLFCGDALFAGEVGRIDLLGADQAAENAGLLYESIFSRILPLGDEVILCPAHGSGSVCGEAIAERLWTSVGIEKKHNPRLQAKSKEQFVASLQTSHPGRPPYFRRMEKVNLEGRPLLGAQPSPLPLDARSFWQLSLSQNAQILDTRQELAFSAAHVPGSQSIWLDGLASFAGWFLGYDRPILLVGEGNQADRVAAILLRLGFDNISGFLAGGMLSWHMSGQQSQSIRTQIVQDLCRQIDGGEPVWILDVRFAGELDKDGRIEGAQHIPITAISERMDEVPQDRDVAIFCGSGMRSMVAASYLRARGWKRLSVVLGGMAGWRSIKCPLR
ncbi:MAG: molybdopterin biosynthesis protein MoeB [Methanosaeta sp. PtaU1.Bin112]|nr:MAG: molybdopterin biosynthesis protein MoeB [Methanosaeta sp. PtaU1.Bin112]